MRGSSQNILYSKVRLKAKSLQKITNSQVDRKRLLKETRKFKTELRINNVQIKTLNFLKKRVKTESSDSVPFEAKDVIIYASESLRDAGFNLKNKYAKQFLNNLYDELDEDYLYDKDREFIDLDELYSLIKSWNKDLAKRNQELDSFIQENEAELAVAKASTK